MLYASILSFVMLSLAGLPVCLADLTLTLPAPEPPLSADIIGAGADGETTYLLFPGQPNEGPAIPLTFVEGASNMGWDLVFESQSTTVTMVNSCAFIASGMAECLAMYPGQTTRLEEIPVTAVVVQGGGTVSPAPTSATNSAVPAATQSAASPSNSPSKSASSGARLTPGKVAGLGGMSVIWAVLA